LHVPEERTTRHSHYNLNYHLVFTPKYRRHVFVGEVRERLMQVFRETCSMRDWIVLGDVAKILKGVSARRILQEFPKLRRGKGGGHLWTPSFYVGSAQTIQRYTESQRKHQVDDD